MRKESAPAQIFDGIITTEVTYRIVKLIKEIKEKYENKYYASKVTSEESHKESMGYSGHGRRASMRQATMNRISDMKEGSKTRTT